MLDALEESHAAHIWHLDLKPGNIMVNERNEAVLIDFGASKQVRNANGDTVTTSTANCFTPGYAPSELMEGATEKFGPFTDMYSLGATLYNLLTRYAVPPPSVVLEEGLPPYNVPVSHAMQQLITWMMEYARTQRPQNVEEVRNFIREHFDKTPPATQCTVAGEKTNVRPLKVNRPQTPATPQPKPQYEKLKPQPAGKAATHKGRFAATLAAVAVVLGVGTYGMVKGLGSPDDDAVALATDSVTTEAKSAPTMVNNYRVSVFVSALNDSLRYTYSGPVVNGLPEGKGRSVDAKGNVYEGNFTQGLYDDDKAHLDYANGDAYTGSFRQGSFHEGTIRLKDDGSYFTGTFSKGQPTKGSWYRKDGTLLETVESPEEAITQPKVSRDSAVVVPISSAPVEQRWDIQSVVDSINTLF